MQQRASAWAAVNSVINVGVAPLARHYETIAFWLRQASVETQPAVEPEKRNLGGMAV